MKTLNELYSSPSVRRRYEVWFLRLGLADGSGAWWFRYLLLNPARGGCARHKLGMPVQVWATWFPAEGKPQSVIKGFSIADLQIASRNTSPFHLSITDNEITENSCRGHLQVDGHDVSWDLHYSSSFRATLSNKGWIGFSRTAHSDAVFSGRIQCDGKVVEGDPLGFGLQGHNCGYRHRTFWTWAHAHFPRHGGSPSTFEALTYDMPFGLVFRKAVLWHDGKAHVFRKFTANEEDRKGFRWKLHCLGNDAVSLEVKIDGSGTGIHRLPYLKTDCSGTFEVTNNSRAHAKITVLRDGQESEALETAGGAVLEMAGER